MICKKCKNNHILYTKVEKDNINGDLSSRDVILVIRALNSLFVPEAVVFFGDFRVSFTK